MRASQKWITRSSPRRVRAPRAFRSSVAPGDHVDELQQSRGTRAVRDQVPRTGQERRRLAAGAHLAHRARERRLPTLRVGARTLAERAERRTGVQQIVLDLEREPEAHAGAVEILDLARRAAPDDA